MILACEVIIFIPIFYVIFVYPLIEMMLQGERPSDGDTRIVQKFVLWLNIGGEKRWFTKAKIEQRYEAIAWEDIMGYPMHYGWVNRAWVD